jgi:hypothetical protein
MPALRIILIALLLVFGAFVVVACADAGCEVCGHACCAGIRGSSAFARVMRRVLGAGRTVLNVARMQAPDSALVIDWLRSASASTVSPLTAVTLRI